MSIIQRFFTLRVVAFASCLATTVSPAQAALTIDSTRIVHGTDSRNSSVIVANPSNSTFAAQAWVNTEEDDTVTPVPLIASPALFRLDPGKQQMVQINRLPNDLPEDRESLFYFNVQEIPQQLETNANLLNIALRTRIKLFYRPSQVKGVPEQHLDSLQWSLASNNGKTFLQVLNPTPYHFTFGRLEVGAPGKIEKIDTALMAMPMQTQSFELKTTQASKGLQVQFTTINDYGGTTRLVEKPLSVTAI